MFRKSMYPKTAPPTPVNQGPTESFISRQCRKGAHGVTRWLECYYQSNKGNQFGFVETVLHAGFWGC